MPHSSSVAGRSIARASSATLAKREGGKVCLVCGGTGEVESEGFEGGYDDCENCGGSGWLEAEEEV